MDGPDLLQELQRIRPGIKAMLVSGYAGDAESPHRVEESDVPFLEKPFTTGWLAQLVREVLGGGHA